MFENYTRFEWGVEVGVVTIFMLRLFVPREFDMYLKRFTLRQIVSYRYFCRRSSGRTLKILNTLIWFWQVNAAIEFLKNSKPQTNYHHWLRHNNLMPHWLPTRKTTTPGRPLYCSWFSRVMKSFVNSLHQLTRMEVFLHTA